MDNPGRHDTNHVTGLISEPIAIPTSLPRPPATPFYPVVAYNRMYPRRAVDCKECDNALKRDTRVLWARAFPKGYINFLFRGNFNQFTIHAASTYAQPRAVVIRAANQKLSSEQPDRLAVDATSRNLYSQPKARRTVGKYRRKGCIGNGEGKGEGEMGLGGCS